MSAFLGPIHHWLYHKIKQQHDIVSKLCTLGDRYGLALTSEVEARYGTFPSKPLEEIIDGSNIHGWLQEKVSMVEYQYAYAVIALLNQDNISSTDDNISIADQIISIIKDQATDLATAYQDASLTAPQVFKVITDHLLDGMPCDHANLIVEQSPESLTWKRKLCVHQPYWTDLDGDINIYYALREVWLEGFLEALSYSLVKLEDSVYQINSLLI